MPDAPSDQGALASALDILQAEARWRSEEHIPRCRMLGLSTEEIKALCDLIRRALPRDPHGATEGGRDGASDVGETRR